MQIYIFFRAMVFLIRQRIFSQIRLKYSGFLHLEPLIYRAKYKYAQIAYNFYRFRSIPVHAKMTRNLQSKTKAQKYLFDCTLEENQLFKLTSKFSKEVRILPGNLPSNFKQYFTKNFLLDGSIVERGFDLGTHQSKVFVLNKVSLFKFKYVYNKREIFIFDQFINEFASEYYGRFSEIFFLKSRKISFGYLPRGGIRVQGSSHYSIFGQYYNNYWHFMIEYLPKLLKVPKNSTIVMPSDFRFKNFFLEIAEELDLNVIEIRFDKVYYFEELSFISTPVKYLASNSTSVDFELLLGLQKLLSRPSSFKLLPGNEYYYLLRSSIRRINLDSLLVSKLSNLNFSCVDLYDYPISYQKSLFCHSSTILGNAGSSWANFVFAPPKVHFFNIVNARNLDQSLHHAIARVFGLDLINIALCDFEKFLQVESNSYSESESAANVFTNETAEKVIEILCDIRN